MGQSRSAVAALVAAAAVSCLAPAAARGVMILSSPSRNTSAPTGTLADSGWQYQGSVGAFLATPIAPQYFITAEHIGGAPGSTQISYQGSSYSTTAYFDTPDSDLRIWKIDGAFQTHAPLYRKTRESGASAVLFGAGTPKGGELRTAAGALKGWTWGPQDGVQSWGQNNVSGIVNAGAGAGSLLAFSFDARGGTNEAALSVGDSGGAAFIKDGVWKLAGIHYAVDGPFSLTGTDGSGVNASVFDRGGLYSGGDGRWQYTNDGRKDLPGASYSTRISSNLPWIDAVLAGGIAPSAAIAAASQTAVPEPASTGALLLASSCALLARRRRQE